MCSTPSKPELAFSISLIEFLHALNLEMANTAKDLFVALQSLEVETKIVFDVSVQVNGH